MLHKIQFFSAVVTSKILLNRGPHSLLDFSYIIGSCFCSKPPFISRHMPEATHELHVTKVRGTFPVISLSETLFFILYFILKAERCKEINLLAYSPKTTHSTVNQTRSTELNPGLPREWQEPNYAITCWFPRMCPSRKMARGVEMALEFSYSNIRCRCSCGHLNCTKHLPLAKALYRDKCFSLTLTLFTWLNLGC